MQVRLTQDYSYPPALLLAASPLLLALAVVAACWHCPPALLK